MTSEAQRSTKSTYDMQILTDGTKGANTQPREEQHFRLLDLPSELRNRIYSFALHHSENDGTIAPAQTTNHRGSRYDTEARAVMSNQLVHLRTIQKRPSSNRGSPEDQVYALDLQSLFSLDASTFKELNAVCDKSNDPLRKIIRIGRESSEGSDVGTEFQTAHICDSHCLIQPPLTQVSRQIRSETLPVFYAENDFAFITPKLKNPEGSVAGSWWRCIGDINLGHIRSMALFDDSGELEPYFHTRATQTSVTVMLSLNLGLSNNMIDRSSKTVTEWRKVCRESTDAPVGSFGEEAWERAQTMLFYADEIEGRGLSVYLLNQLFTPPAVRHHVTKEFIGGPEARVAKAAKKRFEDRYAFW
ncbi:hypothetical protein LTR37_017495 [Vermiconidia calcicola]|uniref:Uncharacterized protein n=1 Tax=Vermiconidia calcicola TaxID=1690605 RepID=A0ACC3MLE5_9PEZI|nr:hypothetical protein LTR37_017495 [Vermiconidia calcicola]